MESTDAPQIIEMVNHSCAFTPFETRWIPSSARFVVLGQLPKATGTIQIFELTAGGEIECKAKGEKAGGLKCGTFGASSLDQRSVATGDYKGNLNVYDLERLDTPSFSVQGHDGLINAIDGVGGLNIGCGAPEIVTGGRDGCVRVWDPRVAEPVVSLEPESAAETRDCWTVAFGNSYNDEERCVAAGFDNGDVKLFDLRMGRMVWEENVGNGVTSVQFDRKDIEMNKLCCTTLEGNFRIFDLRTYHSEKGYAMLKERAHKSTVWCAAHMPQNRELFATTGGNGGINLYRYSYPSKRTVKDSEGQLEGVAGTTELLNARIIGSQPIVSFDWSPDKEGLAVMACLDQTVRVQICTKLDRY